MVPLERLKQASRQDYELKNLLYSFVLRSSSALKHLWWCFVVVLSCYFPVIQAYKVFALKESLLEKFAAMEEKTYYNFFSLFFLLAFSLSIE